MAVWYHFAIMFEALFILTVLDAGTRVGRFMVQDLLGHVSKPLGVPVLSAWSSPAPFDRRRVGLFPIRRCARSAWRNQFALALFGISNQLLAAVALVVATTILLKMGKLRWIWVTVFPMAALVTVTMVAAIRKSSLPIRASVFFHRKRLTARIHAGSVPAAMLADTWRLIFNQRLDAVITAALALMVLALVAKRAGGMGAHPQRCDAAGPARSSLSCKQWAEVTDAFASHLRKMAVRLWWWVRQTTGDAAYENYLRAANRAGCSSDLGAAPLSPRDSIWTPCAGATRA